MSVDLIVIRGLGNRQGDDIENRLVCTTSVALELGRNELDENSGLQSIAISSVLRATLRPGQVIEVQDALQGTTWRGKISSVRHLVDRADAMTELEILRPQ